jgi:hypothetical protein
VVCLAQLSFSSNVICMVSACELFFSVFGHFFFVFFSHVHGCMSLAEHCDWLTNLAQHCDWLTIWVTNFAQQCYWLTNFCAEL